MKLNILAALAATIAITFTTTPALAGPDMESAQVVTLPPVGISDALSNVMIVGADLSKNTDGRLYPQIADVATETLTKSGFKFMNFIEGIPSTNGSSLDWLNYINGYSDARSVNRDFLCQEAFQRKAFYILLFTKTFTPAKTSYRRSTTTVHGVEILGTKASGKSAKETSKPKVTLTAEMFDIFGQTVLVNQYGQRTAARRSFSKEWYSQNKELTVATRQIEHTEEVVTSSDDLGNFFKVMAECLMANFPLPPAVR